MTKIAIVGRLLFLSLALAAGASQACYTPPGEQTIGVDEQLGSATNVAVAQVIGATPLGGQNVEYRFLVLKQLAGPPQKVLTVMGRTPAPGDNDTSFHGHQDFAFWAHGGGRAMNGSDCVIQPNFVVGNTYLVFLDTPPTRRSFEKLDMVGSIVNHHDTWLIYVKAWLGVAQPVQSGMAEMARRGRLIYRFNKLLPLEDIARNELVARHIPPELLDRVDRLLEEYDRTLKRVAQVPDAQLDAVLREAGEVRAALAAWRTGAGH